MLLACGSGTPGYSSESDPSQMITGFSLSQTSGGERLWVLQGDSGKYTESDSSAVISGVRLTYYRLDAPETLLTGDSGRIVSGGEDIRVWGDVRVETVDGRILETPELVWVESLEVFSTDCVAVLTVPDSLGSTVITGRGVRIGQDLGSAEGVDVRENFMAVYTGEIPSE